MFYIFFFTEHKELLNAKMILDLLSTRIYDVQFSPPLHLTPKRFSYFPKLGIGVKEE